MNAGKKTVLADFLKNRTQLRLKDNDNSEKSPVQENIGKVLQSLETEKIGTDINCYDQKDSLEDLNRTGIIAYNPQNVIENKPYDKDIGSCLKNGTQRQYRKIQTVI